MPSLNFQKQFVTLIENGQKRQTIRDKGKREFKPGDKLFLFYGLRTKLATNILPQIIKSLYRDWNSVNKNWYVKCQSVQDIEITEDGIIYSDTDRYKRGSMGSRAFAKADGFKTEDEFYKFFKQKKERVLIKW